MPASVRDFWPGAAGWKIMPHVLVTLKMNASRLQWD